MGTCKWPIDVLPKPRSWKADSWAVFIPENCYRVVMLRIGIVGLTNVGKSTLFQALTRVAMPTATDIEGYRK